MPTKRMRVGFVRSMADGLPHSILYDLHLQNGYSIAADVLRPSIEGEAAKGRHESFRAVGRPLPLFSLLSPVGISMGPSGRGADRAHQRPTSLWSLQRKNPARRRRPAQAHGRARYGSARRLAVDTVWLGADRYADNCTLAGGWCRRRCGRVLPLSRAGCGEVDALDGCLQQLHCTPDRDSREVAVPRGDLRWIN